MHPLEIELTPEERAGRFEPVARWLVDRRLHVPAILALEMHRPLAFLGSQALIVLTPFLAPAVGLQNMQRLCAVLAEPGSLELLIQRIEELAYAAEERPISNPHPPLP
jgi:hypothetical protein